MTWDRALDQLRAEHGGSWNVFASADGTGTGWLYASRAGRLTDAQMRAGCVMTVCAPDPARLRDLIADQADADLSAA